MVEYGGVVNFSVGWLGSVVNFSVGELERVFNSSVEVSVERSCDLVFDVDDIHVVQGSLVIDVTHPATSGQSQMCLLGLYSK